LVLLAVGTFVASGCNNGSSTSTTTPTSTTTVTATYSGNLNQNGAVTFPFTTQAGTVTATLTALADPTVTVGLSLGDWTGSSCIVDISNDATQVGVTITGTLSAAENACVRIYDVGNVKTTLAFTITVVHP
jgi:hypothetical protein